MNYLSYINLQMLYPKSLEFKLLNYSDKVSNILKCYPQYKIIIIALRNCYYEIPYY